MRSRNQRSIEDMGFHSDFALVAVLLERLQDSVPVELLGALRHDAFPFELYVQHALLRQQAVAMGERNLVEAERILGIPVQAYPPGRDQLQNIRQLGGGRDVL